jgi:3',5'-cyclic AMP phosphodiesterase CpdA
MRRFLICTLLMIVTAAGLLCAGCGERTDEPIHETTAVADAEGELGTQAVADAAAAAANGWSFLFISATADPAGGSDYRALHDLLANAPATPELILHGGDVVQDNEDRAEWDALAAALEELPDTPLYAAWGELDGGYFSSYCLTGDNGPEGLTDHFYSLTWENVHFCFLDSTYMGLQRDDYVDWLTDDIAANGQDWNVVICHHALYPAADVPQDAERAEAQRAIWLNALEQAGVDLVLSGHETVYGRTDAIRQGDPVADGIVYVQTCSGAQADGASPDAAADGTSPIAVSHAAEAVACLFRVADDTIEMTAYTPDGTAVDLLTLHQ